MNTGTGCAKGGFPDCPTPGELYCKDGTKLDPSATMLYRSSVYLFMSKDHRTTIMMFVTGQRLLSRGGSLARAGRDAPALMASCPGWS